MIIQVYRETPFDVTGKTGGRPGSVRFVYTNVR